MAQKQLERETKLDLVAVPVSSTPQKGVAATRTETSFAQTGASGTNTKDAAARKETSFAQTGARGTNESDATTRTETSFAQPGASGTNTRERPFLDLELAGVEDESDSDYDYGSEDDNVAVENADDDIADTILQTQDEEINFQVDPQEADANDVPEEAKSATRSGRPVRMRTQRGGRTHSAKENIGFFVEDSRKIDAVLTLGTVHRRAIERHAQQDIGKAKVKEKYMAASD